MPEMKKRRPVANFFLKRSIQVKIITEILLFVLISTLVTTLLLAFVYSVRSQGGSFYYMSNNIMEDLKLQSILGILLPALITAQLISILIAAGISLFSSRKVAVPIYKIEKWAAHVLAGDLNASLAFRESKEMRSIASACNAVTAAYREIFGSIGRSAEAIAANSSNREVILKETARIREILGRIHYTG